MSAHYCKKHDRTCAKCDYPIRPGDERCANCHETLTWHDGGPICLYCTNNAQEIVDTDTCDSVDVRGVLNDRIFVTVLTELSNYNPPVSSTDSVGHILGTLWDKTNELLESLYKDSGSRFEVLKIRDLRKCDPLPAALIEYGIHHNRDKEVFFGIIMLVKNLLEGKYPNEMIALLPVKEGTFAVTVKEVKDK